MLFRLALLIALLPAAAASQVLHVPAEYPSIQAAVDAAMPGDTVLVANGTYAAGASLRSRVVILGESRDGVRVEGSGQPGTAAFSFNGAAGPEPGLEGAAVERMTIRGFQTAVFLRDDAPHAVPAPVGLVLRDLAVDECTTGFDLAWTSGTTRALLELNTVTTANVGLRYSGSAGEVEMTHSVVQWADTGVSYEASGPLVLTHNVIVRSLGSGLDLQGGTVTAEHNTFVYNWTAIRVQAGSATLRNNVFASLAGDIAVDGGAVAPTTAYNVFAQAPSGGYHPLGPTDIVGNPDFSGDGPGRLGPNSAAIDAADPASPYQREPAYNGRRANAGAYGNTPIAATSAPEVEVPAQTVDLGLIGEGAQTVGIGVPVTNTGRTRLDLRSVTIESDQPGVWGLVGPLPDAVAAGETDTLYVAVLAETPGRYSGILVIETNDEDEPVVRVPFVARRVTRLFVDGDAAPGGDGETWQAAYASLPDVVEAVRVAPGRIEMWVAEGTYRPAQAAGREASFVLRADVALYGGFSGTETTLEERDWQAHPTVLSGDIGVPGDSTDNAYVVVQVVGPPGMEPSPAPALLDGVTVTGGVANDIGGAPGPNPRSNAGGVYVDRAALVLRRAVIAQNAGLYAGGLFCQAGSIDASDLWVRENRSVGGSSLQLESCSAAFTRTAVERNRSQGGAGGMSTSNSSYAFSDGHFTGNVSATGTGVGLSSWSSSATLERVVFEQNRCTGGYPCSGGGAAVVGTLPGSAAGSWMRDVTFARNEAANGGGLVAMDIPRLVVERATFLENHALGSAGAVLLGAGQNGPHSTPTVFRDVRFERNRAGNEAGAVNVQPNEPGLFVNVDFISNRAGLTGSGYGGALSVANSQTALFNATFVGNSASYGGAITTSASPLIANAEFVGNTGGEGASVVEAFQGQPVLVNTTMAANGPRLFRTQAPARILLRNAVVWGNTMPTATGADLLIDHAVFEGGHAGTAVLNADPLFSALDAGADGLWGTSDDVIDLRLQDSSPGIDAGITSLLPADRADLDGDGNTTEPLSLDRDGQPREQGAAVDLGPYERSGTVAEAPGALPLRDELSPARPNPFRAEATLGLTLARDRSRVVVDVIDVLGRSVTVLHDGPLGAGEHHVLRMTGTQLPSGVYVVRVQDEGLHLSQVVTLVR